MDKIKLKFSLIAKVTLMILVVVGIVGVAMGVYLSREMKTIMTDSEKSRISNLLDEQTHEIQYLLTSGETIIASVAKNPDVVAYLSDPKRKTQNQAIISEFKKYPLSVDVKNLYLLDKTGVAVLSEDPSLLGGNYSFRNYFKEALAGRSSSEWGVGVTTKVPGFYFSQPVLNNGQVIGVAVLKVGTDIISQSLQNTHLNDYGYFMMVDGNGVIIYSSKPDTQYKSLGVLTDQVKKNYLLDQTYYEKDIQSIQYDDLQKLVLDQTPKSLISRYDEEDKRDELLYLQKVNGFPFYLIEEENLSAISSSITSLLSNLIIGLVVAMIFVELIEILFLRRFIGPLNKLSSYAKSVSSGNINEELLIDQTGDEIQSLSESVKSMVQSLRGFTHGLEDKIKEKTAELENTLKNVESQNKQLEEARQAMLNVLEDLDEEKNNINNEKQRVETILSSIGDGVFVTDSNGNIALMNKIAQKMSGQGIDLSRGKPYSEVFKLLLEDKSQEAFSDFVKEAITSGERQEVQPRVVLESGNGDRIPVNLIASPLKDAKGEVFGSVVVVHDNTKERNIDKSKDEFLSVASHQLRTPLGGMRWNLEMIQNGDYGPVSDPIKEVVDTIHQGSLKMIDLVNDLLNVSRIDQGRVMDEPVETDLGQVIGSAVASLTPVAGEDGVTIKMNISNDVPKVIIDPKRFNEVVVNLISNGIKYHIENGWVEISLSFSDDVIRMTVSDNGIGIPRDAFGRVFEKFFRAGNAAKSETEGSGLGLYICKKFIDGWGGKITFESEEGKGTTFTVLLPKEIRNIKTI